MTVIDNKIHQIQNILVWKTGDQRAPHKPLLLLLYLAAVQRGDDRMISYEFIEEKLTQLLIEFGRPNRSYHPEYPFWRLQNDGNFWEIPEKFQLMKMTKSKITNINITPTQLKSVNAKGGFSEELYNYLRKNADIVNDLVMEILASHFEDSLLEGILNAVNMPWVISKTKRLKRSPDFRDMIIRIYNYKCAICGFDGKMKYSDLALEAAHVKWHSHGGPDSENNGLAMCIFHHRMFDKGALGLSPNYKIFISQEVHGGPQVHQSLINFSGKIIQMPQKGSSPPSVEYIFWHKHQVFRNPARDVS